MMVHKPVINAKAALTYAFCKNLYKILQVWTERKAALNLPTSPTTLADIVADIVGIW